MKDSFGEEFFIKSFNYIKIIASTEAGREQLKKDPKKALANGGFSFPKDVIIKVLENVGNTLNVVIPLEKLPTQLQIKGLVKNFSSDELAFWLIHQIQQNPSLKTTIEKNPIAFLEKNKIKLHQKTNFKFHENTSTIRYFVLPHISESVDLSQDELRKVSGGSEVIFGSPVFGTGPITILGGSGGWGGQGGTTDTSMKYQ